MKTEAHRGAILSKLDWLAVAALLVALLATAASAKAATVTTTTDGGPGSLRQALIEAQPGETINVPSGTYVLSKGELKIEKAVTIAGAGAATTTISGGRRFRIFNALNVPSVTISGLTLRDGIAKAEGAAFRGINVGDVTLSKDVLTRNSASATAGAIFGGTVSVVGDNLTIADSKLTANVASADGAPGTGGGEVNGGVVFTEVQSVSILRTAIEDNQASARGGQGPASEAQNGGALLGVGTDLLSFGAIRIADSTFAGNAGDVSGGPGGTGGRAKGGGGPGGTGGRAKGGGGAIISLGAGKNLVTGTTITGNKLRAGDGVAAGGGIQLLTFEGSPFTVSGSTIVANAVQGSGEPQGEVSRTAAGNLLSRGIDSVILTNTIVADGVGPAGSENCGTDVEQGESELAFVSRGFNLDPLQQCFVAQDSDVVKVEPLLGPLQDNGGPTKTMLPLAGSPAIDQGTAAGLKLDQRGLARTVDLAGVANSPFTGGDGTDIGAVEVQASK